VISSSEISDDASNSKLELIVTRTAMCQYSLKYFGQIKNFVRTEISQRRYPGLIHACKQRRVRGLLLCNCDGRCPSSTRSKCNRIDGCRYAHRLRRGKSESLETELGCAFRCHRSKELFSTVCKREYQHDQTSPEVVSIKNNPNR
jgi:hypothetical protein